MLQGMAAPVLSASTSFCASLTESFSLMGHERAFIPSRPGSHLAGACGGLSSPGTDSHPSR